MLILGDENIGKTDVLLVACALQELQVRFCFSRKDYIWEEEYRQM